MQLILQGSIPRLLIKLATPNVAVVVTTAAMTLMDVYFVGRLGTTALASLAVVYPFQALIQMMSGGAIGGGVASAISRALGAGAVANAESRAWHAMVIAAVGSVLYMIILGVFSRPIFALIIGPGEVLDGAVNYAHIYFGGASLIWFAFMFQATLRGTGEMAKASTPFIFANIFQIGLSGALTLGWGPFPALGISGPAVAALVSHGLVLVYFTIGVLGGKGPIKVQPHRFSWLPIKDIMKVGGLSVVNSIGLSLTVIVVTAFIGRFGSDALAGYGLGSRLELMLIGFAFGLGGALVTAVGGNVGAGQMRRARRIAWTGAGITLLSTAVIGLFVAIMPGLWVDRFTSDPAVHAIAVSYLRIAAPVFGLFCGGYTLYFASQGTGNMIIPVSITWVRLLVVAGICFAAAIFDWGLDTVFVGVAVGLVVVAAGHVLNVLKGPGWRYD